MLLKLFILSQIPVADPRHSGMDIDTKTRQFWAKITENFSKTSRVAHLNTCTCPTWEPESNCPSKID